MIGAPCRLVVERAASRELRIVERSPGALRELLQTGAVLRALEARFATGKITDAALDRMAALIDSLVTDPDRTNADYLRIAREFDMEIEKAPSNPTLRGLIQSLSIVGQERRTRSIQSMRAHTELAQRRLRGHRDILAALRSRDPDAVEKAFRRHAITGVELLLGDLDQPDLAGSGQG